MQRISIALFALIIAGQGCVPNTEVGTRPMVTDTLVLSEKSTEKEPVQKELSIVFPTDEYLDRVTFKHFGEYIEDRFNGFHVADDVEFTDREGLDIPVYAIADGIVERSESIGGYGGFLRIRHTVEEEEVVAIYGHLDLTDAPAAGEKVLKGQQIALLGDEGPDTDGERKHLHFGLYRDGNRVNGYESADSATTNWVNPHDLFLENGLAMDRGERVFTPEELGGDVFTLRFPIPDGYDIEYIPQIQALNIFSVYGEGSARERSQVLIRYFDASDFLTLNTVSIHETTDLIVGKGDYTARRYDIEKKTGVEDFEHQPPWRNDRHIVTDFRGREGRTRYFVVAANPELDPTTYESLLASIEIVE